MKIVEVPSLESLVVYGIVLLVWYVTVKTVVSLARKLTSIVLSYILHNKTLRSHIHAMCT